MRHTLTKAIASMIISIIVFYPLNPKFIIYLLVMVCIWAILLTNFKLKKNSQFFFSAFILSITNLIGLVISKQFIHHTLHKDWLNIVLFILYVSVLIVIFGLCIYYVKKQLNNQVDDITLFTRRRYDLERIKKYIETEEVLGINGIWGSGKSFLVTQLKKRLHDSGKYIFIDVDLLSCNLDELQTILLNEMEKALYEHRIVPTHSSRLNRILNNNAIYRYVHLLMMHDDMSYSKALTRFIQEIDLLDKTIVIVYEDIDRISNIDIVKKIFSISEKLASKNIKIIYQYEESNLRKLGLERGYLEKYIPFIVNLTPIEFIEIVESIFQDQEIDLNILKLEDLNYLTMSTHTNYYFEKALEINLPVSLQMDYVAIRKVKNFIKELVIILNENKLYYENKREVINFYFIKHFFTTIYDQFNPGEGLLETIKFENEDKQHTILELIAMRKIKRKNNVEKGLSSEQLKILFEMKENKEKLYILNLFEYDLEIEETNKNYKDIVSESEQHITKKASNEKKDRLIWNLLFNGKSEYTNYETAANKLIAEVLSKPKDEQKKAYKVFADEMYHGIHEKKDNKTIFRIGIPSFISLAQALRVSNITEENWKQFISFYFEYTKKDVIDLELIHILNYCNLNSRAVYLDILKRFNALKTIGNMNFENSYKHFLKNYLGALTSLGYVNTSELWMLDVPDEVAIEANHMEEAIMLIARNITNIRDLVVIEMIKTELDTITAFIDKNLEIIKCEPAQEMKEPKFNTSISSRFVHQEEYDRLNALKRTVDKDQFMKELEISYRSQRISVYEIGSLLKPS